LARGDNGGWFGALRVLGRLQPALSLNFRHLLPWSGTDEQNYLYTKMPVVVGAVFGMVFVLMAVAFRSLVIAVKAVISIGLTQIIVFGFATCVYQYGALQVCRAARLVGSLRG
jgi:uncharacterized membrane protein YdfJ with MMPL/SSD domain